MYPPLARQTNTQGDVRVRITTDGESVREVEAEAGSPLLRKAAEDNVRSWKFATHVPGTFYVTFRYKISSGNVEAEFLESSALVEIEAPPPKLIIDYAWLSLGTWKAQWKSAHGTYRRLLSLRFSGPHEDWLDGNASGPNGEKEEIDYGHKERDFLAFTILLTHLGGKQSKSFFIGKMTGDKIFGTFVDDTGSRGEWTAIRVPDKPDTQ